MSDEAPKTPKSPKTPKTGKKSNVSTTMDIIPVYTPGEYEIVSGYTPNVVMELPTISTKENTVKNASCKILLYDKHVRLIYNYLITYNKEVTDDHELRIRELTNQEPYDRVTEQVDDDTLLYYQNVVNIEISLMDDEFYRVTIEYSNSNRAFAVTYPKEERDSAFSLYKKLIKWKVSADLEKTLA